MSLSYATNGKFQNNTIINCMKKTNWNSNPDYAGIDENSTDLQKLDVVFNILKKTNSMIAIHYRELFIEHDKEPIFDAKLLSTDLVEDIKTSQGQYNPYFKLNNKGLLVFEQFNSYSSFKEAENNHLKSKHERIEEKENLEMQKLRSENIKLVNELADYSSIKKQRNIATAVAIVSLILLFVRLMLGKR